MRTEFSRGTGGDDQACRGQSTPTSHCFSTTYERIMDHGRPTGDFAQHANRAKTWALHECHNSNTFHSNHFRLCAKFIPSQARDVLYDVVRAKRAEALPIGSASPTCVSVCVRTA